MPKFSINDPVSFINEKQDGIIKAIKPNGICIVEIEDGFDIEALESELVLIRKEKIPVKKEKPASEISETFIPEFSKNIPVLAAGIWLVACPAQSGMVLTGPADYYVVNNTEYTILFAASLKSGKKLKGVFSSKITAQTELYISTLKRNADINNEAWHFQLIFHKNGEYDAHSTVTKELSIEFPDLASANSKLKSPYAFCKITNISGIETMQSSNDESLFANYTAKDLHEALGSNSGLEIKKAKSQAKHSSGLEVDLHIEELGVNFAGLSNAEIINIQIQHFKKKLDEAIIRKSFKIVFIHGVGNGKLKNAIRQELSMHNLKFSDGPYGQYGGGATEVIL